MRILICGNGEREKYLADLCLARGHSTPDHGPWDMAVLPLPRSYLPEDIADQLPRGQKIVCGMTDAAFDRLAEKRGWKLLRVLKDEVYTTVHEMAKDEARHGKGFEGLYKRYFE